MLCCYEVPIFKCISICEFAKITLITTYTGLIPFRSVTPKYPIHVHLKITVLCLENIIKKDLVPRQPLIKAIHDPDPLMLYDI